MSLNPDVLCLAHLRWDFVYQRPQHLMSRAADQRRVYYCEVPRHDAAEPHLETRQDGPVTVVTPHLRTDLPWVQAERRIGQLLADFLHTEQVRRPLAWVYTPMLLPVTDFFETGGVVYDCMDELGGFCDAPPELQAREQRLFRQADVVFTGGHHLWEAKRSQHPNVHAFPSSVDVAHFAQARQGLPDPADQQALPRPRLGFYGVIDERFDLELVRTLATRRPEWQFVFLGPVVKIDPSQLPQGPNLHYLGMKSYAELPAYLTHWDVALLPFARNAATEFISPTKTPEYLAAGVPVVSTAIHDVVRPYGDGGLVSIASDPQAFEQAIAHALEADHTDRQRQADTLLSGMSWDRTWDAMNTLVQRSLGFRMARTAPRMASHTSNTGR
ncbi:glycosyltransferase family 1 protein [Deinococcus sonorensis]|uniref:Glycosyltransferase family 1 protein n=2 Tax=Deinococcus sonorensis TaxID=309891 RepID=A0AAU7UCV3_9DEIO